MNATDELRKQAYVKTLGPPYRYRGHRPTYAIPEYLDDFAMVDGKLYAIDATWDKRTGDGVTTTWAALVPPSGETAK